MDGYQKTEDDIGIQYDSLQAWICESSISRNHEAPAKPRMRFGTYHDVHEISFDVLWYKTLKQIPLVVSYLARHNRNDMPCHVGRSFCALWVNFGHLSNLFEETSCVMCQLRILQTLYQLIVHYVDLTIMQLKSDKNTYVMDYSNF